MNNLLNIALHDIELDLDRAQQAAAERMVRVFRYLLEKKVARHKVTIEPSGGVPCLHINDYPWHLGFRGKRGFPVVQLLDDIDVILEKCDNAVIRHITGIVL